MWFSPQSLGDPFFCCSLLREQLKFQILATPEGFELSSRLPGGNEITLCSSGWLTLLLHSTWQSWGPSHTIPRAISEDCKESIWLPTIQNAEVLFPELERLEFGGKASERFEMCSTPWLHRETAFPVCSGELTFRRLKESLTNFKQCLKLMPDSYSSRYNL